MSSSAPNAPKPTESASAPSGGPTLWTGWAAAACFALATAYFGAHYFAIRGQLALATTDADFSRTEAQDLAQRLEAERIVTTGYTAQLQKSADVANLKIIRLTDPSISSNAPCTVIAVWNLHRQEGILSVDKLPFLPTDQDYQLWLTDSAQTEPVNGGVFTVEENGAARVPFHPSQNTTSATAFTITREAKGGAAKPEGPVIATGKL
ncbi:MAG: anti-sigma factor [Nibricoccus sp.]